MIDKPENNPENEMPDDSVSQEDNAFEVELESLDDFLKGEEESAVDETFSLDEEELIPLADDAKGGSMAAKIAGYVVLLAMLGGLGYAGVKYMPQLTGADEMNVFEQNMMDRSQGFEQDMNAFTQATQEQAINTPDMPVMADNPATIDPFGAPIMPNDPVQPMPMASDSNTDPSFADPMVMPAAPVPTPPQDSSAPMPDDIAAMMDTSSTPASDPDMALPMQAGTISEALEITQGQPEPAIDSEFDVAAETEPMDAAPVAQVESEATFEAVETDPMIDVTNDDLPPISDDQIETVDQVMNEDPAVLEATVEAENEMAAEMADIDAADDEIVIADASTAEPVAPAPEIVEMPEAPTVSDVMDVENVMAVEEVETVEPTLEAEPVPTAPVVEEVAPAEPVTQAEETPAIDVAEVKATPPSTPKAVSQPTAKPVPVETKPAINSAAQLSAATDPRIYEGRAALKAGNFAQAQQIFDAVLRENPSNVHALTGKQMAVSGVRYTGNDVAPTGQSAPSVRPTDMFVPRKSFDPTSQSNLQRPQQMPVETQMQPTVQQQQGFVAMPAPQPMPIPVPVTNDNGVNVQDAMAKANANPRDATSALRVGDAYRAVGDKAKATEWYRKALQLDALYASGLDRMAVYDRLSSVK